ncbi:MAG: DUF2071 domain-containing protein [Bacillaceae bacterium]|nr:DUF2071 domain-containing protein [Bacillaceae bacterium]
MNYLSETQHRPYAPPSHPWIMRQTWRNFIFAHWPVSPASLRPLVPSCLDIDMFNGHAWVGIYTFCTKALYLRGIPFSIFSPFYGINLRTYVRYQNKPGVYFIQLYSTHRTALRIARAWYHLNYHPAHISYNEKGGTRIYQGALQPSERKKKTVYSIQFNANQGNIYYPQRGTLDYFLTERYRLYSKDSKGQLYCGEIHHPAWPLQKVNDVIINHSLLTSSNLKVMNDNPVFHYSRGFDVLIWNIKKLDMTSI